jgi:type II secretory pathway pseudopilin PulG
MRMDGAKFQPAAARRLLIGVRSSESGQTLIEVLIAAGIFAIVSAGLIYMLTSTVNISSLARQKTLAQQAVASEIDYIRNLPYSSVGNVAGNPSGTIALTQSINIGGKTGTANATQTTKISYVNDPTPLSYQSYANYKQVTITITRSDGTQLAREVTNIAPPVKASQSQATIIVTVVDTGNNTVVPNATVNVANGPSGSESDTTDATGKVTFAGLLPTTTGQPNYDVTVTPPAGYVALKDTQPPNTVAHFPLSPGQTQPAALQIYQPVTIYVQLQKYDGTSYTGAATITVSSSRGTQTFAYASPQTAITAINSELLVPGLNYTVNVTAATFSGSSTTATVPANNYPSNLSSTFVFTAATPPTNTVLPTVSGTPQVGQTLTATTGTWTGTAPISYSYQWQSCNPGCANVGTNQATYTPVGSDGGGTIQVIVTASNIGGTATATSAATGTVTGPPVNTAVPTISGTVTHGFTLTAAPGTWSGFPVPTYTYQWQRCAPAAFTTCTNIAGATGSTYVPVNATPDKTYKLLVIVTATNSQGTASKPSAQTATAVN